MRGVRENYNKNLKLPDFREPTVIVEILSKKMFRFTPGNFFVSTLVLDNGYGGALHQCICS